MEELKEFKGGLTLKSLVVLLILIPITIVIGDMTFLYTNFAGTFTGLWIPFVFVVLFNELLGRVNKKLRLTPQELLVILPAFMLAAGGKYIVKGVTSNEGLYGYLFEYIDAAAYALNGAGGPTVQEYWNRNLPAFMFPLTNRAQAAQQMWTGLKLGETVYWSEWITPILYVALFVILVVFVSMFLVFGLIGKPWVETERLVFPMSWPHSYLIEKAEVDPEKHKFTLFNLKETRVKIFWLAFPVGVLFSAFPLIAELFPELWPTGLGFLSFAWGELPFELGWLSAAMPGAHSHGYFAIDLCLLWLLAPFDILLTGALSYIVVNVIYQSAAVRLGLAPDPGPFGGWEWNWWQQPPFPYGIFVTGLSFGVAIWCLWRVRDRFKLLASTIQGKDVVEQGLSMRFVTIFGSISWLGLLGFFTASGIPFAISLMYLVLITLWLVALARCWAELAMWSVADWGQMGGWPMVYSAGAAMGYWPWSPPAQGNTQSWFITASLGEFGGSNNWMLRTYPLGSGSLINYFKIAHYNKLNFKHMFIAVALVAVIGQAFGTVFHVWILNHGGGATNMNSWGWFADRISGNYVTSTSGMHPQQTFGSIWGWTGIGAISAIVMYILRVRFAWFFVHPVAIIGILTYPAWLGYDALVALIIKVIAVRTIGTKRFTENIIPVAAGFVWGFITPYFFAGIYNFCTVILPKFSSLYVP